MAEQQGAPFVYANNVFLNMAPQGPGGPGGRQMTMGERLATSRTGRTPMEENEREFAMGALRGAYNQNVDRQTRVPGTPSAPGPERQMRFTNVGRDRGGLLPGPHKTAGPPGVMKSGSLMGRRDAVLGRMGKTRGLQEQNQVAQQQFSQQMKAMEQQPQQPQQPQRPMTPFNPMQSYGGLG